MGDVLLTGGSGIMLCNLMSAVLGFGPRSPAIFPLTMTRTLPPRRHIDTASTLQCGSLNGTMSLDILDVPC